MNLQEKQSFAPQVFLGTADISKKVSHYAEGQEIYSQGDFADAIFQIQGGRVKVAVYSSNGKEAIISILGPGDFFGEECIAGQRLRTANVTTLSNCSIMRIDRSIANRLLGEHSDFSESFFHHLLSNKIRLEEDLLDHHFSTSEKRLARVLLRLANSEGKDGKKDMIPRISQETLAAIVGTTRSRVSKFMNKFRKLGFIDYKRRVRINSTLQNVVLQ